MTAAPPRSAGRDALATGDLVVAVGCYDVLTAKVLAGAGSSHAYLTPFGFQATDVEGRGARSTPWRRMLDRVGDIRGCCGELELIVDAHSGIEGRLGVRARSEQAAEAGAAAVVIEDRSGFGSASELLSVARMRRQIGSARAGLGSRAALIARTDAPRASLADARERCVAYLEAGADLVMPLMTPYLAYPDVESTRERREEAYAFLREQVPAERIVIHSPHGRHLEVTQARATGYGVYLMPQLLIATAVTAMSVELGRVLAADPTEPAPLIEPTELARLTGIEKWLRARW